jgi:hypothetical protein
LKLEVSREPSGRRCRPSSCRMHSMATLVLPAPGGGGEVGVWVCGCVGVGVKWGEGGAPV